MYDQDASNWIDEDNLNSTLAAPLPGEEDFFLSHAGGESSLQQIFIESMAERYVLFLITLGSQWIVPRKRHEFRTQQDQVERQMQQWQSQLPDLVNVYLLFIANGAKHLNPTPLEHEIFKSSTSNVSFWSWFSLEPVIDIDVFPYFDRSRTPPIYTPVINPFCLRDPHSPWLYWCIARSTTASLSIQLLAYYRQLRRVHSCFSLDAFAKSLNHFHSVSWSLSLDYTKTEDATRSRTLHI